jgi:hypothetical protein
VKKCRGATTAGTKRTDDLGEFYMAHETEPTLHLWNQAGEPGPITDIPFGVRGICGPGSGEQQKNLSLTM